MIVVDTSALAEYLLRTPAADAVAAQLFVRGRTLHAPHLLDMEFAQTIRRLSAAEKITASDGQAAMEQLETLRLRRYPHTPLLHRVWQLRHNLTAYDAAYVALAEALNAPLLTCDRRIARAPGHNARVELV